MSTMWVVIDKIYDDLRSLVVNSSAGKENDSKLHVDSENGFQIHIPSKWVVDKEVKNINPLTRMCINLVHEDLIGFIHPSINVVVEIVGKASIEDYVVPAQVSLASTGAEILDVSINPQLCEASIKSMVPNQFFGEKKASVMQKLVIRNKKVFVLTLSQLPIEEMNEEEEIVDDIAKIIQSFSFVG